MPSALPIVSDRYEVLGLLGEGGMGRVHLAFDKALGRRVALKVLKGQHAGDEGLVARFGCEAKNAASLCHENVIRVFDAGEAEDGTPYITMEHVAGGTLKERVTREGPLEPREAARIAREVALALAEAHEKGIVHRDVKPHNVLLDESGLAKVADFGIARAAEATLVTQTSLILGTASYLSPEQARGDPVGPESDLYSLGVTLYEMLTGTVPFSADNPIAIAMKHILEPPPSPKAVNSSIPDRLDALTLELLSKDPEHRPPDARRVASYLLLDGSAEAPTTKFRWRYPELPRERRHSRWGRTLVVTGVLLTTLVVSGAAAAENAGVFDAGVFDAGVFENLIEGAREAPQPVASVPVPTSEEAPSPPEEEPKQQAPEEASPPVANIASATPAPTEEISARPIATRYPEEAYLEQIPPEEPVPAEGSWQENDSQTLESKPAAPRPPEVATRKAESPEAPEGAENREEHKVPSSSAKSTRVSVNMNSAPSVDAGPGIKQKKDEKKKKDLFEEDR